MSYAALLHSTKQGVRTSLPCIPLLSASFAESRPRPRAEACHLVGSPRVRANADANWHRDRDRPCPCLGAPVGTRSLDSRWGRLKEAAAGRAFGAQPHLTSAAMLVTRLATTAHLHVHLELVSMLTLDIPPSSPRNPVAMVSNAEQVPRSSKCRFANVILQ
jgi:hypothetical protein